jgi:ribose transport system permease protein
MRACRNTWVYSALLIAIVLAFIIYVFDRTRFGCNYRALKEGQKVAVDTGIREVPNAIACYTICGGLMGVVGFLYAVRTTNIDTSALNFGSIGIMFTAFLPMFIGGYISRFSNEKLGFFLAALCMSMLNSTFAVFSNEIKASTQSIINAVLLVLFLIYLSNEYRIKAFFRPIRK